jgi:hypothetical protein
LCPPDPVLPPEHTKDGMTMMTSLTPLVTGGVDAHTDTHHAAVLDGQGRLLGTKAFATTARG